ncbi:MAG: flagellar hook-length control protein FliK [Lachnospiraceae bacterium]|nr:flagellar hook-length control protein FliK [Lachnospiraceae bacterium]
MPRITDSITTYNTSVNTQSQSGEISSASQGGINAGKNAAELGNLKSGQMIQARVVSTDGQSIQISLNGNNSNLINARLDNGVTVTGGRTLTFEVKSNADGKLVLSPLFTNLTSESTAFSALREAGLGQTPSNLEMVATMMKEGMSVDKESLYAMHHRISETGEVNPGGVVTLTKLGIPVTNENLEQLTQYQNAQGKITGAMMDIADSLTGEYGHFLAEGNTAGALRFADSMLGSVGGEKFADTILQQLSDAVLSVPVSADEASALLANLSSLSPEDTVSLLALVGTSGEIAQADSQSAMPQANANSGLHFLESIRSTLSDTVHSLMGKNTMGDLQQDQLTGQVLGQEFASDVAVLGEGATVGEAEIASLSGKEVGMGPSLLNPEQQKSEVLNMLRTVMLQGKAADLDSSQVQNLMNALADKLSTLQDKNGAMKLFEQAFTDKVAKEWNIEPGELSEKTVKELYTKLLDQTRNVLEQVRQNARPDSPVQQSVQNLQNNILFMNQMNHVFSYIQIPLRNMGQSAQGELYVYSRGKNHFHEDGNISALLHLDMPHLGPMDVYVALTGKTNVNTNFYLADDQTLDLIAEHIDELSARLAKKGYTMNAEFVQRNDEKPMMQQIIEDHRDLSVIQSNSFDMRA